ncbi:MAG: hypothetical protein ACE5EE_11445 [Fidelibacterota bacterium]
MAIRKTTTSTSNAPASPDNDKGENLQQAEKLPFSQAWLYKFYWQYERILSPTQKSILNAVLKGMGEIDQLLDTSSASPKQIATAKKIINYTIRRYRRV